MDLQKRNEQIKIALEEHSKKLRTGPNAKQRCRAYINKCHSQTPLGGFDK